MNWSEIRWREIVTNLLGFLLVLGVMFWAYQTIGIERIREWILSLGSWGVFIFILITCLSVVLAPILSSTSMIISGTLLFGGTAGFWYSYLGIWLGCLFDFFLAHKIGKKLVSRWIGNKNLDKINLWVQDFTFLKQLAWWGLILYSPETASYSAGVTNMNFWYFLLSITVGVAMMVAIYTLAIQNWVVPWI